MCNLYSETRSQEAVRRLFRVTRDVAGNLPPLPGIFPDMMPPVVRIGADGERQLEMMRWGMPPPHQAERGRQWQVRWVDPHVDFSPLYIAEESDIKPAK